MGSNPSDGYRRKLTIVFVIVFIDLLGFGILFPLIPLYAEQFGASELVIGVLIAAYSITQFIFAPILGRLSDQYGRRPVLLVSLAGSVIAWTLFGLADGLLLLFVARLLAGAMGGNIATAHAYIADITTAETRAEALGMISAAHGLGLIFGPALGGLFSSHAVVVAAEGLLPAIVPITQFTLPSFVAAAITAVNLLGAIVFLPESNRSPQRKSTNEGPLSRLKDLRHSLTDRSMAGLIGGMFLLLWAFSVQESMFVLFTGDTFGFGPTINGYLFAYLGLVVTVIQAGLIGPLTKRFGERRLALGGAILQSVMLVALPFTPVLGGALPDVTFFLPVPGEVLLLLLVISGLSGGHAVAYVSVNALVSMTAGDDEQGGAFGVTQSAGSLARATGPILAGALYSGIGYWMPYVAAGLLALPLLYLLMMGRASPESVAATRESEARTSE